MTQKLTLFSQEVEDFVLEIKIDADATFRELHDLILDACKYTDMQNHTFLICDEDWRVRNFVRQTDPNDVSSEEDLFLMADTPVSDFLEDEGQRLAYIFDPAGKRFFLMELTENIFGEPQPKPEVSRRHGIAPAQHLKAEQDTDAPETISEHAEEFRGSEDVDESELDLEGFEISE